MSTKSVAGQTYWKECVLVLGYRTRPFEEAVGGPGILSVMHEEYLEGRIYLLEAMQNDVEDH